MRFAIGILFSLIINNCFSQTTDSSFKVVQFRGHYGFIIAHSQAVENTAGSHPVGVEVEFLKQRVDSSVWNLCN